jgi:acylphosphatase
MEEAQVLIMVSGKVQGVYYRDYTRKKAMSLNLRGYAKNLADGRVEVLARGPRDALEQLIDFCRQGSPAAEVRDLRAQWQSPGYEAAGFGIG